jgi:hypothetical protein
MLNYDISQLLKKLRKKKIDCIENITETFYSKEGIYQIGNRDIIKLDVINETSKQFYENESNWILDESVILREKVFQLPVEHIKITIKQLIFSQSPDSKVNFIIEMFSDNENIIDFYFDVCIKQSNEIPWQEINRLLLIGK